MILSSLAGTSMLGCDRTAKDRTLKDPATIAAEKAKADEAKKLADKAKADADAAAASKGDSAGTKQQTGATGSNSSAPKTKTDAELADEKARAEEAKNAAEKLAAIEAAKKKAEAAVAAAKSTATAIADGKKRIAEETTSEEETPAVKGPSADPEKTKADAADKLKNDGAQKALLEKQASAKSIDLLPATAPQAIVTAASSLVKVFVPAVASGPKTASELAKNLNMPKKNNTPLSEIISFISASSRVDKYVLLLGLRNCGNQKATECKIYDKAIGSSGFVSSPGSQEGTVITTTAGFLDNYTKTMVPKGKVKTAEELKALLTDEIKALVTKFVESDDSSKNYFSDGGATKNSAKVSLLSISDEALKTIFDGTYSEGKIQPNKNIVTLRINKSLELSPIPRAKGSCIDKTSTSQDSYVVSYQPKTKGSAGIADSPGKNIVATSSTTPATTETIKKLKDNSASLGVDFALSSESSDLEKSLVISNTTVRSGVAGSPILNDRGEYYGIVSSIGAANSTGAFPIYGACVEEPSNAAAAAAPTPAATTTK